MAGLHWSEIDEAFDHDGDGPHGHVKTFRKAHAKAGGSAGSNPKVARALQRRSDKAVDARLANQQQVVAGDDGDDKARRAAADEGAMEWLRKQHKQDPKLASRLASFNVVVNGQPVQRDATPFTGQRQHNASDPSPDQSN